MDLEASDDEVQMWSSPIRIPQVLKLHPENLYAINGARSCIREHFCSDVRCVVPKLLTKVLLQHRHGGLSIFILHSLLGRTVE
ncbi:uncharacterized protein LOC109846490 isoform X7 [Asparagus officinalis]|uniref:uncharacterized protein LOC109846490 isoform X7 n=1 Tax=Asparagus officinalis TaxID=4686 RepID=UPI00098E384B|nr:uncharacterized protein LOC109846490 isoform X7 [Asparagus officinalis]